MFLGRLSWIKEKCCQLLRRLNPVTETVSESSFCTCECDDCNEVIGETVDVPDISEISEVWSRLDVQTVIELVEIGMEEDIIGEELLLNYLSQNIED